jgi:hypothetical protein
MKRKWSRFTALLLAAGLLACGTRANAWSSYTYFLGSPSGNAGIFKQTSISSINYAASSSNYLYRNQVVTSFADGTADMPSEFTRYTERGAYAFTDSVANPSNPNSYIIAKNHWAEFGIDPETQCYWPRNWTPASLTNQLVETSGTANLRLRFMFDIYGTDGVTAFPYGIFMYRFGIIK